MAAIAKLVDGFSGAIGMNVANDTLATLETRKQFMMSQCRRSPFCRHFCGTEVTIRDVAWKGPERRMEVGNTAVDVGDIAVEIKTRG